jgi:hypothetical protein
LLVGTTSAVGEVASEVLDALNLVSPVVASRSTPPRWRLLRGAQTYVAPSRFPRRSLDLAFVVDASVPAAAIERTLRRGGDALEDVRCFDEFRGGALGDRPPQPRVRPALPVGRAHVERERCAAAAGRSMPSWQSTATAAPRYSVDFAPPSRSPSTAALRP